MCPLTHLVKSFRLHIQHYVHLPSPDDSTSARYRPLRPQVGQSASFGELASFYKWQSDHAHSAILAESSCLEQCLSPPQARQRPDSLDLRVASDACCGAQGTLFSGPSESVLAGYGSTDVAQLLSETIHFLVIHAMKWVTRAGARRQRQSDRLGLDPTVQPPRVMHCACSLSIGTSCTTRLRQAE